MKQMRLRNLAIATSTFACAALLSFGWSEQRGVSLSIESAQARVGRPLTPVSVAGVARRQNRRAAYQYDAAGIAGPMAVNYAGIASAAGTPVVAAGTVGTGPYGGIGPYEDRYGAPRYGNAARRYGANAYQYDSAGFAGPMAANYAGLASAAGTPVVAAGTVGTGPYGGIPAQSFSLQRGPWYGVDSWAAYKARGGIVCDPGTYFKGADGQRHVCQ
ncbi:hypothetical protein [Bradyrhizobium liaoningense]|uniref:hypothetical protein n=1 Tax=Bradyrhizobium liaoningense TaxID=43992 RepID=UPI001FE52390|nr:hypothetical protein [Bradyrhizobium liaoningense]